MSSLFAAPREQFFWPHPEFWTVAVSGAAWAAMLAHTWRHAHRLTIGEELQYWLLMVVAMMFPFVLDTVRHVAEFSLWSRRHRAIALFLTGYLAPWLVLGVMVSVLRRFDWAHHGLSTAAAFVLAAFWLRTSLRRRAEVACHRRFPLAPEGWRANRDALRFGSAIGVSCLASCWPLMIACALSGHALVAMAGGFAVSAQERWYFRPRRVRAMQLTLSLAAFYAITALV
ncbi:MAG: DUF2182 domain-containing protein [Acidobacteria bacterium]|nr:DUF2182 domain-containing protein [Acidobacteriota bacterium]